jgi:hypothetical protein
VNSNVHPAISVFSTLKHLIGIIMNTTARFVTLLSTLVLASAPALAGTPSGVGEFALQSTPAASSSLSRQAVMAEALRSDVLDMNGEIAQSAVQTPRSTLTREAVQATALRAAERNEFNSEISM